MSILLWIILGALAGWIASMLAGTDEEMGAFANITAGIVGALVGGFIVGLLGSSGVTGFNLWSLIVSIVGAFVVISIAKMFSGHSRT